MLAMDEGEQFTLPNGNEITFEYDKANRLTDSSDSVGVLFAIAYDDNGNP